jgi:tetratricopeptide (TPR) repeat protein
LYGTGDTSYLDSSIAFGRVAVKYYPDAYRRDKSDVVYQLAKSYELNSQCDSAIKYYLLSDALVPEQVKVMYPLLECFLKENRYKGAKLIASKLLNLDFKNNRMFNDLVGFFGENNQFQLMEQWLIEERAKDTFDKERSGYLNFYICNVQGFQEQFQKALKTLDQAENDFNICYDPSHVIFRVISKTRENLTAKVSE